MVSTPLAVVELDYVDRKISKWDAHHPINCSRRRLPAGCRVSGVEVCDVRWLVLSDTHLGAWTGDELLAHQWGCEILRPELERADGVVLLGDFVDLLFAKTQLAFERAEPFVHLLAETLTNKRLVWLAGNHDHHVLVRRLESLVELSIATGAPYEELGDRWRAGFYFESFLKRRLPHTEIEFAYPSYRIGQTLLSHGHYLDGEVRGSVPNRLLEGGIRRLAGGRGVTPSIEDYEAALVPLTELLYVEAQLPKGAAAEQRIQADLRRIVRITAAVAAPERELYHLARALTRRLRGLPDPQPDVTANPLGRPVTPGSPVMPSVNAYARVCRHLGWDREARWLVFAHTHQPLDGVRASSTGKQLRFWNTGSWIYEPPRGTTRDYLRYLRHNWPGSVVVLDDEAGNGVPRLLELLAADRAEVWARLRSGGAPDASGLECYDDVRRLIGRT